MSPQSVLQESPMAKLEILNISKTYQASEGKVLNDISLTVNEPDVRYWWVLLLLKSPKL